MGPWRHEQERSQQHYKRKYKLETIKMSITVRMNKCHITKNKFYNSIHTDELEREE